MLPYNTDTLHVYGAISAGKYADITRAISPKTKAHARNSFSRLKARCSICIDFEVAVNQSIYTFQTKQKNTPTPLHIYIYESSQG